MSAMDDGNSAHDQNDDVAFTDEPGGDSAGNHVSHVGDVTGEVVGEGVSDETTEERDGDAPGSTGPTSVREDLGTLADEARKLLDAVESRFVAPLVRSYPEVSRHLGAAGRELAAAVRTAVRGQEQLWRDRPGSGNGAESRQEKITVERVDPENI